MHIDHLCINYGSRLLFETELGFVLSGAMHANTIKDTWDYIKATWTEEIDQNARAAWRRNVALREAHASCFSVTECPGCGTFYCKHLEVLICGSFDVCVNCDAYVEPNPYNPKNSAFVAACGLNITADADARGGPLIGKKRKHKH